jgi:hypothetical protein
VWAVDAIIRDVKGLDSLAHDVREGVRRLARQPRFTSLAAGTLALGLAASTAVLGYVNATLDRSQV